MDKIKSFLGAVAKFFEAPNPQTEFEEFIKSKNPTTTAEVDFWAQEYDNRRRFANKLRSRGEYTAARWYMSM